MKKFLKYSFIFIVLLIVIAIIALVVVINVVDPNQFKKPISQQVYKNTGHTLKINGDMNWRFYPRIGVEMNDVELAGAPGFGEQPLFKIQTAAVDAKLLPLLIGNVKFGAVTLEKPQIYLIKNKQGKSNWEIKKPASQKANAQIISEEKNKVEKKSEDRKKSTEISRVEDISVASISIKDGDLLWINQQSNRRVHLKKFFFAGNDIGIDRSFPISTRFNLSTNQPAINSNVEFDAQLKIEPDKKRYALKKLEIKADDNLLTGNFIIKDIEKPDVVFNFDFNQLNLDRYFPPKKESKKNKKSKNNSRRQSSVSRNTFEAGELPLAFLRDLKAEGKVTIKKLIFYNMKASNIRAELSADDGIIKLSPISGEAYNGKFQNDVTFNVKTDTPVIASEKSGENFQIGALLKDYYGSARMTGVLNYKAKMQARGKTLKEIYRTMNGDMNLAFKRGAIKGVNITKVVQTAVALFKRQPLTNLSSGNETKYGELTMSALIRKGVVSTNDLLLLSPAMKVTGKGKADLNTSKLDFLLLADVAGTSLDNKYARDLQKSAGGIPMRVEGTFDDFRVVPDKALITELIGKAFLEEKTKDLKEKFRGIFGQ